MTDGATGKSVFKQELWAQAIQNALDEITGLKSHSDYSYTGEIKYGNKLNITGSARPTVGNYVIGTGITIEDFSGVNIQLEIDTMKYVAMKFDDVDLAQSIPSVMENQCRENAKYLHYEADKKVADTIKDAYDDGVVKASTTAAVSLTKANAVEEIEKALVKLYEKNVPATENLWGEFTPKFVSLLRQNLITDLTNNVELAKQGAVGTYAKVAVCMENLLPGNGTNEKYNIIRTSKAVAFAGQIDKVEKMRMENQFADLFRALYVCGCKVVRPDEIIIIRESI